MPEIVELTDSVSRYAMGIKCNCGGFADPVNSTAEECTKYGCGRDRPGMECCARAFQCNLCGTRWVGSAEAPEME